jgi:uncharacterized protein YndB with AHSA1/START domain
VVPADPERLYKAWLDPVEHAAMTGAAASGGGEQLGAPFTAWDGYILGRNIDLGPGLRLVQAWRTTDFPAHAPDSRLEIRFEKSVHGTLLKLTHSEIPEGQGESYREGWLEYYLAPMVRYFGPAKKKPAAKKAAPKKAAKPARKAAKAKPAKRAAAKKVAKKATRPAKKAAKKPAKKAARKSRR